MNSKVATTLKVFRKQLARRGLSENTVKAYMHISAKWLEAEPQSPEGFLASFSRGGKQSTRRLAKSVLAQLHDLLNKGARNVVNPWRELHPRGKPAERCGAMLPALGTLAHAAGLVEARRLIVVKTILWCGVQPEELAKLRLSDVGHDVMNVQAGGNLLDRQVPLEPVYREELGRYLARQELSHLPPEHPLFFSLRNPEKQRLTRESIFRDCMAACGNSPRQLRAICACRWYQAGMNKGEWATRLGYASSHGAYLAFGRTIQLVHAE